MGHKVDPRSFRIPYLKHWKSRWFAEGKKYKKFLQQDTAIKEFLEKRLKGCEISDVEIRRERHAAQIEIKTAKPGLIIGRGGVDIKKLREDLQNKFLSSDTKLKLNIIEEASPLLSAQIILERIILDLEKRMPYRRVARRAIERVTANKAAQGIKISIKGRLNGSEIAREEKMSWGKLPLQTIRADIDYAEGKAQTLYGLIGVKVWLYKGEKFISQNQKKKDNTHNKK